MQSAKSQTKYCAYRKCPNTNTNSDLSFFCFPLKDEEKCARWVENAGCGSENLKRKYLCEEHFDQKFLSRASRRTVLVGNAIPYPHSRFAMAAGSELIPIEDPQLYEIGTSNDLCKDDEEEGLNVETDAWNADLDGDSSGEQSTGKREETASLCNVTKRQKLNYGEIKSKIATIKSSAQSDTDAEITFDIDNTKNNSDITTFIFKGQEYIQMPKSVYLAERKKLDEDLRKYRRIVQQVKALINSVDIE